MRAKQHLDVHDLAVGRCERKVGPGIAKNERAKSVYQLWIFDKARDDRYPVDGGVFDIDADGDIVVPIKAKLPVGEAALFAVTVEKPGGVVASSREHIVVTAKPAG